MPCIAVRIKKTPKAKETKFKVRGHRYLYTLTLRDSDKADKLKQSLPPGMSRRWLEGGKKRWLTRLQDSPLPTLARRTARASTLHEQSEHDRAVTEFGGLLPCASLAQKALESIRLIHRPSSRTYLEGIFDGSAPRARNSLFLGAPSFRFSTKTAQCIRCEDRDIWVFW